MPSHYKLCYFNARARGEPARLILAYSGIAWEEERVIYEDWPKKKPTTPMGQLPVLEVDGKPLAQFLAIARYLAKVHGLAGDDDWESAQCDMIVDGIFDQYHYGRAYYLEKDPEKKSCTLSKLLCYLKPDTRFAVPSESWFVFYMKDEARRSGMVRNGIIPFRSNVGCIAPSCIAATSYATQYLQKLWDDMVQHIPPVLEMYEHFLKKNGTGYFVGNKVTWADLTVSEWVDFWGSKTENFLAKYPELKKHKEKIRSIPNVAKWIQTRPHTEF